MIVVCPGCSRKYNIKDESIKSEKKVKCTLCGTIWIVKKNVEPEIKQESKDNTQDPVSTFINEHKAHEDLIQKIPQINNPRKIVKSGFSFKFLAFTLLLSFISVSTFVILFPEYVPFITKSQETILNKTKYVIEQKICDIVQSIEENIFNEKLSIKNVSYKLKNHSLIIYGEVSNTTNKEHKIPYLLIAITPKKPLAKTEYMKYKLREKSIKANSTVKFTLKIGEVKDASLDISIKLKNNRS